MSPPQGGGLHPQQKWGEGTSMNLHPEVGAAAGRVVGWRPMMSIPPVASGARSGGGGMTWRMGHQKTSRTRSATTTRIEADVGPGMCAGA